MSRHNYRFNPKTRFSSRVENYIKYRPSYPYKIISFLQEKAILIKSSIIADVGSGTGILSKLFLENGNKVYGIEPNKDMRNASEIFLKDFSNFVSIDGSAESTGLDDNSIDLIVAGQAFHWFDVKQTKKEFKRVLKPEKYVVLIWNNRIKKGNSFCEEYEKFVSEYGTDYKEVRKNEKNINKFFQYELKTFENFQTLDLEGFKGRTLSTSYMPLESDPVFPEMANDLKLIFETHQRDGIVKFVYKTEVCYGKLT